MYCLRVPSSHCVGDFLEQDVRLAVEHPIALPIDGLPDGLGQVTFPGAGVGLEKVHLRGGR